MFADFTRQPFNVNICQDFKSPNLLLQNQLSSQHYEGIDNVQWTSTHELFKIA
jgi:hypothetical protein